jgi:hypothetical protein
MSDALWGTERRNGIVKDVNDLKMWIKFLGVISGIVAPVLTTLLIKWLGL